MKANVGANIDAYGKGGLDLSGLDSDKLQGEAKTRIAKFQVAGDLEKERALKLNAADTAEKQKRAAEVAAQAAAGLAETRDSVKASIASDTALKVLAEDAAGGSERASAALAKAQATDLDAIQAQTKAALSEQFAAASGATAEAASKTAAGVAKQVETAKLGTGDYAKKSASALSTVSLPSVEIGAPDIGSKVEEFQAAGKASLAKAQEASAKDSEKMAKAFEAAKAKAAADAAQAAADNADAAAAVSAQAAAALQQASSSASEGVLGAVEAKKVEVGKNIEKTDFQSRYAKAKKDAAAAKAAAEAAAAAAQSSLKEAQAAAQ